MLREVKERTAYGCVKVRCVEYNKALASKSNFTDSNDKSNERNFYFTISKSVHHPAIELGREKSELYTELSYTGGRGRGGGSKT